LTFRDKSPLQAEDWSQFRDPDELTYRRYVTLQDEQETVVSHLLEKYADAGHDGSHSAAWLDALGTLFAPTRYPVHAMQMAFAHVAHMAPSSYISNCAAFAAADMLRRVTLVAYRTRELQNRFGVRGFGTKEREIWETSPAWQPARKALELMLATYDWGESFTAVNLVLKPTLDDVLLRQVAVVARELGDEQTWLLLENLRLDSSRCERWTAAMARYAVARRPENLAVFRQWIKRWSGLADEAALALGAALQAASGGQVTPSDVLESTRTARDGLASLSNIVERKTDA